MTIGTVCSLGCGCSVLTGSGCLTGPVLVIGTILSPALGGRRFGAVTVKTPSEDRELTRSATSYPEGRMYRLVNCREMKPCSSCFSSCLPSTSTELLLVLTVISSGANCWTSRMTWNINVRFMKDYAAIFT